MESVDDIGTGILRQLAQAQAKQKEQQREQQKEIKAQREYNEVNNLIHLPQWPEEARGVPNCVLRGSLFAAIPERNAKYCEDLILHETDKVSVKYTGKRLTQSDLTVWEHALHFARKQNLGNKIYFTEHSFLRGMDRSCSIQDYRWLEKVLKKLRATAVAITHGDKTYIGGLIDEAYKDEDKGLYAVVFNSKIARLFEAGNTWISWEERKLIGKRKPLAQWLHGYISTHVKWLPHKIATIRELSGSETKELWKFKQNLTIALKHLKSIGLIDEFRIDEKDLVHITRKLSRAQQKHLDEKKAD